MPYAAAGQAISVAVHNLDGTLVIDNDDALDYYQQQQQQRQSKKNGDISNADFATPTRTPATVSSPSLLPGKQQQQEPLERSLVPISSIDSEGEALAILKSVIQPSQGDVLGNTGMFNTAATDSPTSDEEPTTDSQWSLVKAQQQQQQQQQQVPVVDPAEQDNQMLGLPLPDDYVQPYMSPASRPPREYLSWQCRDMKLLVGSDALIYRSPQAGAVTFRLQDVQEWKALVEQHQEAVRRGHFYPDHQRAALEQQGKPSYAQKVTATQHNHHHKQPLQFLKGQQPQAPQSDTATSTTNNNVNGNGFAAPDLDQVRLQTCIVPSMPMGGLLDPTTNVHRTSEAAKGALSPVSTVVDAYLDNIMANVPQLALCLQEKGFVQSVKLLQTVDIPSALLRPATLDTSQPFEIINPTDKAETEKVFSPQIMEMNAAALLRFLKTNCTRNNTTYLLRREAGETNIQLYDISSISAQKQRKWLWWLAMMSYRFANRLRDLANRTHEAPLARACRNRQRNLLENTLDLLEVLSDMDDNPRQSLVAAVREHLADTFLWEESTIANEPGTAAGIPDTGAAAPTAAPPTTFSQRQPYQNLSVDALEKAQAHLEKGIKQLWPILQQNLNRQKTRKERRKHKKRTSSSTNNIKVTTETEETSSDSEMEEKVGGLVGENEAVATQLYGMHQKLVNLYLRLGEIHLKNYFSSSAMQCLRSAARRLADSFVLISETLHPMRGDQRAHAWLRRSQLQYVWLWEHCGHFARSFGGDGLWRERGHAGADDVLSVLQDAEAAFKDNERLQSLRRNNQIFGFLGNDSLYVATSGEVNYHFLSGVVSTPVKPKNMPRSRVTSESVLAAREFLADQHLLRREERKVFVAACLAYQRAICTYDILVADPAVKATSDLLGLLQQRLGDACNEVGKILLSALRSILAAAGDKSPDKSAVGPLLSSSFFWFEKGLDCFEKCGDLRNLSLLRCNLCQCHKLQANAIFSDESNQTSLHAEKCLQEGVNHLLAAHESLGMRDTNPACWDMVSGELAATYLVLGVRRRQALIGSGNVPFILEALRLSPGKERSIVEPMQRAMEIYEEMGNSHQAAATHYQLALYYSKIWTCQRDESKTREKLAAAFSHYSAAHAFFSPALRGNEATFCLLCLDLSNLYASVQGEEGISKALLCCFDTAPALAPDIVQHHVDASDVKWLEQMGTLASEVEDRVFKLLRSLTKLEDGGSDGEHTPKYKIIYRAGLTAKMQATACVVPSESHEMKEQNIIASYKVLEAIRESWHKVTK